MSSELDRRRLNDLLFERGHDTLTDDEWQIVDELWCHFEGVGDYEVAVDDVVRAREWPVQEDAPPRRVCSGSPASERVPSPDEWRRECERYFAVHEHQAQAARLILGLSGPLERGRLMDYLEAVAEHERQEGDRTRLHYLDHAGEWCRMTIYRGYARRSLREAVRQGVVIASRTRVAGALSGATPDPAPLRSCALTEQEWIAQRSNRLCRIVDAAREVARETGCSAAEAVVFLLCGTVPELPWILGSVQAIAGTRRSGFTIYVGTPLVPAEHVGRFYSELRRQTEAKRDG